MDIVKGLVVRSAAGHDKGEFFVVMNIDNAYAYICDGKNRTMEKTKKKNLKHLFVTNTILHQECLETNRKIRRALREFSEKA